MPEYPYRWNDNSVVGILERIKYTGCTCNFKTYSKSFKLKKRLPNDPENMHILHLCYIYYFPITGIVNMLSREGRCFSASEPAAHRDRNIQIARCIKTSC